MPQLILKMREIMKTTPQTYAQSTGKKNYRVFLVVIDIIMKTY